MNAATANDDAVQVRDLHKRYGPVAALSGMDLTVRRGSITGFLGPNGAGKTTAMRILIGLARRSAGEVRIFGLDPQDQGPDVRSRTGYLAQEPRFYEHLTPRETLRLCLRLQLGMAAARSMDSKVDEALRAVGLTSVADRPLRGFSGGQRQRLGIAQATVHEPDLLILDEPAAALDPTGRAEVLAILERLKERTTVLFSTHIIDDVQRVADRVAILANGRTVAQGGATELRSGRDGTRYGVQLRGPHQGAVARLKDASWVTDVQERPDGDTVHVLVTVSDAEAAEAWLLRRLLEDPEVRVLAFQRHAASLEQVFLDLVSGKEAA